MHASVFLGYALPGVVVREFGKTGAGKAALTKLLGRQTACTTWVGSCGGRAGTGNQLVGIRVSVSTGRQHTRRHVCIHVYISLPTYDS